MAKRHSPPPRPPEMPGQPRGQFILIAVLAVLLLIGGVVLVVLFGSKPPQQGSAILPPVYSRPATPLPSTLPGPTPLPPTSVPRTLPPPQTPPVQTPAVPPVTTAPTVRPPVSVPPVVPPPTRPPVVQRPAKPVLSPQMALGNPSGATTGTGNANNYLMLKPYFALSYNDSHGIPNWVSWHVWPEDIAGNAKRKQTFDTDRTLPSGFIAVTTKDYVGCGFDRGHMCPHSDRDATLESSYATFVMTNIVPQSPNNNQKAWARLEDYGRSLVAAGNVHLAVVAGPAGKGGEGKNGRADEIARARILVPAVTWKVIVVIPVGPGTDTSRIAADCRVIAVIVPNDQSVGDDWTPYLCTVADIEAKTGYTFFDTLPADVAAALRVKKDRGRRP